MFIDINVQQEAQWYGKYLKHAHNHITQEVADMDGCFA